MPRVSDSDLLALGKEVHKLLDEDTYDNRDNCSLYGVGYANGKVENLRHRACHMALMADPWNDTKRVKANCLVISNQVQSKYDSNFTEENMIKYYDFLFNVSVFKDCYVTKDPETCMRDGITVRTDKPANLVVAACIATRQAWEMRHISVSINRMIGLGIPPHKAHLAAHIIQVEEEGGFTNTDERCHYAVYTSRMGKEAIKNFLSGTLSTSIPLNKDTYEKCRNYNRIPEMWGPGGKILDIASVHRENSTSDPFGYIKSLGKLDDGGDKKLDVVDAVSEAFERIGL